jgi:carbon-monoxide dehydrogenase small subunit
MSKQQVTLSVNGGEREVWVSPSDSLLDVLHDELGLGEVRYGCGEGVCGTCTVLMDAEPVSACLIFAIQAQGHEITTLSGLLSEDGSMHPLQECFLKRGGAQCGFCTPGILMTSYSLLQRRAKPTRDEIRYELVGNLCRCTGYSKILDAVEDYADQVATGAHAEEGVKRP